MEYADKLMRAQRIAALETLCSGMPDVDKHFLAERLLSYGSANVGGPGAFTRQDYAETLHGGR